MSDTRDYLDRIARQTADVVTATVEERNDDGTYLLRTIGSRALIRASKANPVDEFALSSRVLVSRPDASRNVLGAMSVIQSRAPREQRGLSGSTPDESEISFSSAIIISVDPDPLVLIAGGEPATQTIYGANLGEAATYAGDDGGTSPSLTDAEDPTISSTTVVMNISADSDSLLGDWNMTVNGARAKNALRVIQDPGPQPSIWALAYDESFAPRLLRINPATMAVYRDYELDDSYHCDIVRVGASIVVRNGHGVTVIDRLSGAVVVPQVAGEQSFTPLGVATDGAKVYYGYIAPGLAAFDLATAEETVTPWDFGTFGQLFVAEVGGADLWATSSFGAGTRLVKIDLAAVTLTDDAPFTECVEMALAPPHIFLMRDDARMVDLGFGPEPTTVRVLAKVLKSDLSEVAIVDLTAGPADQKGDTEIQVFGDFVYGTVRSGTDDLAFRVDMTTMVLESIVLAQTPTGVAVVDGWMFVGDTSGGISAINTTAFTLFDRYELEGMAEVNRLIYI